MLFSPPIPSGSFTSWINTCPWIHASGLASGTTQIRTFDAMSRHSILPLRLGFWNWVTCWSDNEDPTARDKWNEVMFPYLRNILASQLSRLTRDLTWNRTEMKEEWWLMEYLQQFKVMVTMILRRLLILKWNWNTEERKWQAKQSITSLGKDIKTRKLLW